MILQNLSSVPDKSRSNENFFALRADITISGNNQAWRQLYKEWTRKEKGLFSTEEKICDASVMLKSQPAINEREALLKDAHRKIKGSCHSRNRDLSEADCHCLRQNQDKHEEESKLKICISVENPDPEVRSSGRVDGGHCVPFRQTWPSNQKSPVICVCVCVYTYIKTEQYFFPVLTKLYFLEIFLIRVPNIEFHGFHEANKRFS